MSVLIPCGAGNFLPGRSAKIRYIVLHYTAGDGDTARNNCRYFANNARKASAHYFVDETEVCQSVRDADTAWHCGASVYRHPECRNANSIGVELCSRKGENGAYRFCSGTVSNAAALVRALMQKYDVAADHVLRHYDVTGKCCPAPFVTDPGSWQRFLERLTQTGERTNADDPSPWAADAAQWAVEEKLIRGDEARNFRWQEPVTREALAVVLRRWAERHM